MGFSTASALGADFTLGDFSSSTSENAELRLTRDVESASSQQTAFAGDISNALNQTAALGESAPAVRTETPALNPAPGSVFDPLAGNVGSESTLSAANTRRALLGRDAAHTPKTATHSGSAQFGNHVQALLPGTGAAPLPVSTSTQSQTANTLRAFSMQSGGRIQAQGGNGTYVYPTVLTNSRVNCGGLPPVGVIQSETSIAVSGNAVVVSYNDFRGFHCPNRSPGFQVNGWAYSLDGGATFTDGGPLPGRTGPSGTCLVPPTFPQCGFSGDGELAVGPDGTIYLAALYQTSTSSPLILSLSRGTVTDTGIDWSDPTVISGFGVYDKENIAVDPSNGFIYITYTRLGGPGGIWCTHSEDGGLTFSDSVPVRTGTSGLQGSAPVIGPNGEVFVAYNIASGIAFAVSYDNGASFINMGQIAPTTSFTVPGNDRSPQFPQIALDNNPDSPYYGTLYVVSQSRVNGQGEAVLTKSTDGGNTWDPLIVINPDDGTGIEWFPTVSVDSQGRVNTFFYSRRGEPGNLTDLYFDQSVDGGNSFNSPIQVNEVPSNWHTFPADGFPAWGDYIGSVTIGTDAYVAYADGRDGDPDAYLGHVFVP